MVSETAFFRPQSDYEKEDFVLVGQKDILDVFRAKLSAKKLEYDKKYIPFDAFGARMDFDEKVQKLIGDISNALEPGKVQRKIDIANLDEYAKPERFEYLDSREVMVDTVSGGLRVSVLSGKEYSFKSKLRGNGLTMFVPAKDIQIMEDRLKKFYSKNEKTEVTA